MIFWDLYGEKGHRVRTTVAEFKARVKEELERRFDVAQIRAETDQALKALDGSAQFFLSESFIDQKLEEFASERKIEKSELSEGQVQNLKKALAEREQPLPVLWVASRVAIAPQRHEK